MILAATDVIDLQFFLMDSAKRYVIASGSGHSAADDLLGSAAALDYALLLSSERANESIDETTPIASSIRETMTRAALAALDLIERMLAAPDELFGDFYERNVRAGGIFDVFRSLRKRDVVREDDVAFRILTVTDDLLARRRRS